MLYFIRRHPWRLEIVPALFSALAYGSILCYRYSDYSWSLEKIARAEGMPNLPGMALTSAFGVLLLLWLNEIEWNYKWALTERQRHINWYPLVVQTAIAANALLIFEIARISARLGLSSPMPKHEWLLLAILLLSGTLTTLVLELTRMPLPQPEIPEPELAAGLQDRTCYVESRLDPWLLITGFGVFALGMLPILYHVPGSWVASGVWFAASLFFLLKSRPKVTVSEDAVVISEGLMHRRLALSEIESCSPTYRNLSHWPRVRRKKSKTFFAVGRCLEITTKKGDTYVLGMRRPKHACGLIHRFLLTPDS